MSKTKVKKIERKNNIVAKVSGIFLFALFIFTLATYQTFDKLKNIESSSITYDLEVKELSNTEELSGCKTLYVDDNEDVNAYSFDGGVTWKNSNYATVCENKTVEVLGMNEKENIIARGEVEVNDLDENLPKIYLDYETEVVSLDSNELLKGVTGLNGETDVTKNIDVSYEDLGYNNVLVSYYLTNENGTTKVERLIKQDNDNEELQALNNEVKTLEIEDRALDIIEVEEENNDETDDLANATRGKSTKPTVKYTADTYQCLAGETRTAKIKIVNPDGKVTVKKYGSDNNAVATVVAHPTKKGDCKNTECAYVQINCIKAGTAKVSATLSNGQVATATAKVSKKSKGYAKFNKSSYSCKEGKDIEVGVTVESEDHKVTLKSLKSSDTSIGKVSKVTESNKGLDRYYVYKVECKKAGTIKLTATTSSDTSATAEVKVTKNDEGSNQAGYASPTEVVCKKGTKQLVNITAPMKYGSNNVEVDRFKSVKMGDTSIATITTSKNVQTNCYGCTTYEVTCVKSGTTKITATTNKGATVTVPVKVYPDSSVSDKGTVTFDKDYTCTAGKSISGTVTIVSGDSSAELKSLTSSNKNVATVTKGNTTKKVTSFKIKCIKKGTVTLTAKSSTGASGVASVTVNAAPVDPGKVTVKSSNVCIEGKTITETVKISKASTGAQKLKSAKSSDSSIATVSIKSQDTDKKTNETKAKVEIKCIKEGKVAINYTSEKGATASESVTVNSKSTAAEETVKFEKDSISCVKGKKISVVVTSSMSPFDINTLKSSDSKVASVAKDPTNTLKCINCMSIQVTCKEKGTATISIMNTKGAKGTAKVTVKSNEVSKGVKFEKSSYECDMSKKHTVEVEVTTSNASISSIESSSTKTATVKLGESSKVSGGVKYKAKVTCLQDGAVTLTAKDNTGAKATTKVTVKNGGTITGLKNFSCKVGETNTFLIKTPSYKVNGTPVIATPSSFKSSDEKVAVIRNSTGLQVDCIDCRMVEVVCKSKGTATLEAKSSGGATIKAKVTVNGKSEANKVTFDKSSYTCDVGNNKKVTATISAGIDKITSVESSDKSIASVSFKQSGTSGTAKVYTATITCKKKGSVTITATSELKAKGTAKVTVKESTVVTGEIAFAEKTYYCKPGKTLTIDAFGSQEVNKVTSSNKNIATVSLTGMYATTTNGNLKDDAVSRCAVYSKEAAQRCHSYIYSQMKVKCIKEGSVNITATTKGGAKAVAKVTVSKDSGSKKSTVKFDKTYSCVVGKTITGKLTITNAAKDETIKSVKSSDNKIATVALKGNISGSGTKTQEVTIKCVKTGTVTLTATTSAKSSGTTKVTVTKKDTSTSSVKFDKSEYKCTKGSKISGQATVTNGELKSLRTSSVLIAHIAAGSKVKNGKNMTVPFTITCTKVGTATITATDAKGNTAVAKVTTVSAGGGTTSEPTTPTQTGEIKFAQTAITCIPGRKVFTRVIATNGLTVSSLKSSNANVASIEKNSSFSYSDPNATAVLVRCLSSGDVTLTATASDGKTASAKVTVTGDSRAIIDDYDSILSAVEGDLVESVFNVTENAEEE